MNDTGIVYTKESFLEGLVFVVFSYIAILLSFFGNSVVIIAVKKNMGGNMDTTNNYLLLNLSVTDFMTSVVSFLIVTVTVAFDGSFLMTELPLQGVFGNVTCKAYYFSVVTLYLVSIVLILAITVDRALAIFCPLKTFIDKRVARVIVVLTWVVVCVFASHTFYFCYTKTITGHTVCIYDYYDETFFAMYILYDGFLLVSLLVLVILYTMIVVKLWFRTIPGQHCTDAQQRRIKMNRKITVMLVILVLAFYTCHLPAWILDKFVYYAGASDESWINSSSIHLGGFFLMIFYGSINPYIVIIFIPKFRAAFKTVIKKIFPCRNHVVPDHVHRHWDRRENAFHIHNSASTQSQVAGIENQSIQLKCYCISVDKLEEHADLQIA